MAWNEPNGGKDPWGGGGNDGPPDLDELWKKFRGRMKGGSGGQGGNNGSGGSDGNGFGKLSLPVVIVLAVVLWLLSGIYIVQPAERGVVLRFGEYNSTKGPGINWRPTFIDTVEKVNIDVIQTFNDESVMLTQDENIVAVELAVQFRVGNPEQYLFQVRAPEDTLKQATRSAVREVVGKNNMDFILTEGREEIAVRTEALLQEMLDEYQTGLVVTKVNMQDAQPPEPVQAAFDDVTKAREDEEREKELAEAYANDIIPRAEGTAAREVAQAEAYRERVVKRSEGDAERFEKLLTEYRKAPEVTRKRLYLDTMESVMSSSSKVLIDSDGGNQIMYLPLDQIVNQSRKSIDTGRTAPTSSSAAPGSQVGNTSRRSDRSRGR